MTIPATDSDVRKIRALAQEAIEVAGIVRNEAIGRSQQLCAEMVAAQRDRLNAIDFATRFDASEAEEAAQLTAHYKHAVAELSPAARLALENYVDIDIRPGMTWGHDLAGLAAEVPEAWLSHRRAVCERQLKMPPVWTHTSEANFVIPSQ